jgi:hypothetical protein
MSRYWDYSGSSLSQLRQQAPHLRKHMEYLASEAAKGKTHTSDGQPTAEGVEWLKQHKDAK